MATYIQILLSFVCVAFSGCHNLDPNKAQSGISHHLNKYPGNGDGNKRYVDERPVNGDMFSYNNQHAYHHFYHNGYPVEDPYFVYPDTFGMPNFDNMPDVSYGLPSIENHNLPDQHLPNKVHETNSNKSSDEKLDKGNAVAKNDSKKKESPVTDEKLVDVPAKTNENKNKNSTKSEGDKQVDVNAKKDYLLVDNNGNKVYILHENPESTPISNQPAANNVVYVPLIPNNNKPQQPANPVYQIVNGQPPVTTNVPITANKLYGYNAVTNPVQGNSLSNSNNPAYVLIYANGQLIQIPGIVVNPPLNNVQNVPIMQYPKNIMYNNIPNQGTTIPNNVPNGIFTQNPQPVGNPNVMTNNNVGVYGTGSQPNYANQGPTANTVNPIPAGAINNPVTQPAAALPAVNSLNMYQQPLPAQEKDASIVPVVNAPVGNLQPVTQPPVNNNPSNVNNNAYTPNTLIQPAIMVSGFKETDPNNKRNEKENQRKKAKSQERDEKKE